MNSVTQKTVTVNSDTAVRERNGYVEIIDTRAYSPVVREAMELADAVTMARAILRMVGDDGTSERDRLTIDWLEDGWDARHDAVSAHWGHD